MNADEMQAMIAASHGLTYYQRQSIRQTQRCAMQSKLTLRLDEEAIEHAKAYSRHAGKSLSQVVEDFFEQLEAPHEPQELPPVTHALLGVFKRGG